jgi:hypothetical protein
MADLDSEHMADEDAVDDAAARHAAEVAVELSESGEPADKTRIARMLRAVADRARAAVATARQRADSAARRGAATARKGADSARRGAGSARRGVGSARRGAGSAGRGVTSGLGWLTAQVVAMGPRLRIRDQATLRMQFPGQTDDEIAQRLIDRAARAAAAVGGATGAWSALPTLPAFPAEVAAETLAVVGIEVKLVAELHEIYGSVPTGNVTERARAYIGSWAARRSAARVTGGLILVAGSPLAAQLRRRLAGRARRSVFSLSPLFTGAVAGALINRRETTKLGQQIRDDLRQQRKTFTATVIS